MRKRLTLGFLVFLFVFTLTGCGKTSYQETEVTTSVIECEKGSFHQDSSYLSIAYMYLAQEDYSLYYFYSNLANANGHYDYEITVTIEGKKHKVTRLEPYDVGQSILITKKDSYRNSKLIQTEYK